MLKRTLTGLILGIIMIGSLWWNIYSAFVLIEIILLFSAIEWYQHFVQKNTALIKTIYWFFISLLFLLSCSLLYFQDEKLSHQHIEILGPFYIIWIFIFTLYTFESLKLSTPYIDWYTGILYIGIPLFLSACLIVPIYEDGSKWLLAMIVMNWSNDVFAYFTGRLFGKNKLAPDISPNKTWEGALGGLSACMMAGFVLNEYLFPHKQVIIFVVIFSFLVWMSGILGDLFESKLKRSIHIKDSGQILPGHGGFMDRFDSYYFVIPVGVTIIYYFAT
ncbi:MAG: phosphatidate cytidylyltransferase [Bacteroidota bacterium]|nr:phosphatidate cytidylyltransferase [Bacteroidota bacterium]